MKKNKKWISGILLTTVIGGTILNGIILEKTTPDHIVQAAELGETGLGEAELQKAEGEKISLAQRKKEIEEKTAELEKEKGNILVYIEKLDRQLGELTDEISKLEGNISLVENNIEENKLELQQIKEKEKNQYDTMKKRIKYMYENGASDYLEVLLQAENIGDLLNRTENISKISTYDKEMLSRYQETEQEMIAKEETLKKELLELKEMNEALVFEKEAVEKLIEDKRGELYKYQENIGDSQSSIVKYSAAIEQQEIFIEQLLEQERLKVEEEIRLEEERKKEEEKKQEKEQDLNTETNKDKDSNTDSNIEQEENKDNNLNHNTSKEESNASNKNENSNSEKDASKEDKKENNQTANNQDKTDINTEKNENKQDSNINNSNHKQENQNNSNSDSNKNSETEKKEDSENEKETEENDTEGNDKNQSSNNTSDKKEEDNNKENDNKEDETTTEDKNDKTEDNSDKEDSNSSNSTVFRWPLQVSGTITSPFGDRNSPMEGASTNHKGIDIGVPTGTPILAAADGTVVTSSYQAAAGNYIMIHHSDSTYTVYMHCSKLVATVNQKVKKGDVIAYVGSTGISTAPHLHFGVSINGTYVNPLNYVSN